MTIILIDLLKRFWKPLLIIVILAGCWFYVTSLQNTVKKLENDVTTLTVQKDALQANNDTLVASIAITNAAITEIKNLAPTIKKDFDALNAKVVSQSNVLSIKIQKILSEPKPSTCEDTIKYLIDASKEYAQ